MEPSSVQIPDEVIFCFCLEELDNLISPSAPAQKVRGLSLHSNGEGAISHERSRKLPTIVLTGINLYTKPLCSSFKKETMRTANETAPQEQRQFHSY